MKRIVKKWIIENGEGCFETFMDEKEALEVYEDFKNRYGDIKPPHEHNLVYFECDSCGDVMEWGEEWLYAKEEDEETVIEDFDGSGEIVHGNGFHFCYDCSDKKKYLELLEKQQKEIDVLKADGGWKLHHTHCEYFKQYPSGQECYHPNIKKEHGYIDCEPIKCPMALEKLNEKI